MNDFNYFERIAFFHQCIYSQIRQGMEMKQAIGFSFEDSWLYPEDENIISNFVMLVEYINVELSLYKNFRKQAIDLYRELCDQVAKLDLTQYLTEYEIEVFNESIEVLNNDLKVYQVT